MNCAKKEFCREWQTGDCRIHRRCVPLVAAVPPLKFHSLRGDLDSHMVNKIDNECWDCLITARWW